MHSAPERLSWGGHDWRLIVAVGTLALLALTLHLDATLLSNIHETRVLETARVMVADQDWIVPRMNDEVRFNKPPLPYWCSATAFVLAGKPSVLAARLVVVVMGVLMLLGTYLVGRAIQGPQLGILAATILASCTLFLDGFHTVTPDAYLAAMVALSIAGFAWAMRRSDWLGQAAFTTGYVCLALALLSKGPIALVFIALGAWFTQPAQGRIRRPWYLHTLALVLAVLPLVIWAYLVIEQAAGGVEVWMHEVLGRVTGEMTNTRSSWYYLPILLGAVIPLLVFFVTGLIQRRDGHNDLRLWFVAGFVFLMFLSSRKAAYMLPLMPVAALLAGLPLCGKDSSLLRRVVSAQLLLNVVLAAALLGAAWAWHEHLVATDLLLGGALLIVILGLVLLWVQPSRSPAVVAVVLSAIVITTFYEHVLKARLPDQWTYHDMGQVIQREVPADAELLAVGEMEPRISFYANRVPRPIVSVADLAQELPQRQRWVLSDHSLGDQASVGWKRRFVAQKPKGKQVFYLYQMN